MALSIVSCCFHDPAEQSNRDVSKEIVLEQSLSAKQTTLDVRFLAIQASTSI